MCSNPRFMSGAATVRQPRLFSHGIKTCVFISNTNHCAAPADKNETKRPKKPGVCMNAKLLMFAVTLSGFAPLYLVNPHTRAKETLCGVLIKRWFNEGSSDLQLFCGRLRPGNADDIGGQVGC